jgi:hypothetical protein
VVVGVHRCAVRVRCDVRVGVGPVSEFDTDDLDAERDHAKPPTPTDEPRAYGYCCEQCYREERE